ncbi:hypothetical protein Fmac_008154 [Flemingia macrophylla]|uniref:Uncharacterized protein n=1 Tax=Flemingia macrophylla TaxID=520843 RepID=A0ABD1MWN4_9FABA
MPNSYSPYMIVTCLLVLKRPIGNNNLDSAITFEESMTTDEVKLLLDSSRDLLESSPLGFREGKRQKRMNGVTAREWEKLAYARDRNDDTTLHLLALNQNPLSSSCHCTYCLALKIVHLLQVEFKRIVSPLKYQTRILAAFPGQQGFLEQFETIYTQARSEAASCPGGSESTSVDPVDEEIIHNKSWIAAAGGITNRGRLYGVGKVGSTLRLGDTFLNLSSSRSTQESEKILQLEQEVRQSREEARQSREEARQSSEQNERLQHRFQSLFNVVLPLLPSETQQILQQQANLQPENEHDQQPPPATGHYGDDY